MILLEILRNTDGEIGFVLGGADHDRYSIELAAAEGVDLLLRNNPSIHQRAVDEGAIGGRCARQGNDLGGGQGAQAFGGVARGASGGGGEFSATILGRRTAREGGINPALAKGP